MPEFGHQQATRGQQSTDHIQPLRPLGLDRMRFTPGRPGGTVGRLRRESGLIDEGQLDVAGLGLSDQVVDSGASLLESFRVAFFFKL